MQPREYLKEARASTCLDPEFEGLWEEIAKEYRRGGTAEDGLIRELRVAAYAMYRMKTERL